MIEVVQKTPTRMTRMKATRNDGRLGQATRTEGGPARIDGDSDTGDSDTGWLELKLSESLHAVIEFKLKISDSKFQRA